VSRRWRCLAILFFGYVTLALGKVSAQSISGSISGLVTDNAGNPLGGVALTVTNVDNQVSFASSTDANGNYQRTELPAGTYAVSAHLTFFRDSTHRDVIISVGRATVENFVLSKPPPNELLTVTSTAPPTDPTSATLSSIFSKTQIQTLPLLTRDPNSLALLVPGVFSVRTFSFASTLVPFSTNGARGRDNNFIIDSVDNNEPLFGGAATQFTNTDVFSDYSIITAAPKAEFGRGTGATVNVITRNGGNDIHGTAFWFGQDDLFNASNRVEQAAFLKGPAPFYENIGGATVGGPIKKDRAWFFVSYQYDGARNNLSSVYPVVATVPTPAGLGVLQQQSQSKALVDLLSYASVQNPPTGSPCAINPNPGSSVIVNPCTKGGASVSQGASDCQNNPTASGCAEFGTYLQPTGNIFDVRDQQISGRVDYKISESQSVYGRYLVDNLHAPESAFGPPGVAAFDDLGTLPEERNFVSQRTQSFLLDHRHYTANSVNELRFAFSRIAQGIGPTQSPIGPGVPAATVTDSFGGFCIPPTPDSTCLPDSNLDYGGNFQAAGNAFTIGQDTSPTQSNSNIFQAQENYSRVVGRNTIKFGADWVYTQTNVSSTPSDLGHYFFGSPTSATGGLSSFISEGEGGAASTKALAVSQRFTDVRPVPGGKVEQGPATLPLRETDIFAFVQDDIRVKPNLTLNLGVRYEVYGQPIDSLNAMNAAVPFVSPDVNNFAPRLGFAWSPWKNSSTVIRGGYAVSYSPMVLNIPLQIWQSGPVSPFVYTLTAGGAIALGGNIVASTTGSYPSPPLSLSSVTTLVNGCSSYAQQQGTPGTNPSTPLLQCSTRDTVAHNLVNPYVQNFTLGVQHELPHQILFEVDGVGSNGAKLYQRLDLNPYAGYQPSSERNCAYSLIAALPDNCLVNRSDNRHGDVLEVTNDGWSTYYAFQTSVSKRTGPLVLTAAYTWSHMIDNASEIFGPGVQFFNGNALTPTQDPRLSQPVEAITPLPQDSSDLAAEKGNSSFDRRHRLAVSYIWNIPSPQQGLAKTLFGNWQLSGITSVQSGQSFTPLNSTPVLTSDPCTDANGDGSVSNDRPLVGNPSAPLNSVALLGSCVGLPQDKYVSFAGLDQHGSPIYNSITKEQAGQAHFVQWFGTANPFSTNFSPAGRNVLTGPGIVEFDTALYKQFKVTEKLTAQFRWEIYDLFNTPNPGFALGNAFAVGAQSAAAFAVSPTQTAARITGVIPENAIDARPDTFGRGGFLNQTFMNTSSRRMQFGIKFIF